MEPLEHDESPDVEDAAMEAAFDGTAPTVEPEAPEAPPEADEPESEVQEEVQPEEPQEQPLTRAELRAIEDRAAKLEEQLSKVHDKAFGKIGELQQRIETLRTKTTGLSPKAKERLSEEFPELAEMLFDSGESTAQADPEPPRRDQSLEILERVKAEREQERKEMEKRLLRRDHPDWETVVASDGFRGWVSKLPPQEQQELANSWDADFISQKLAAFKDAEQSRKATAEKTAGSKNKRLESAIVPRGAGRGTQGYSVDEEEAAMREAFGG